jgi:glycosyltransferase involved in cell wall biosynthesis
MSSLNADLARDLDDCFAGVRRLLRRVHLLGLHTDMRTVYAAADVVALTSSYGEAAPLCLIEGAMCGAVPVATDVGDCAAIVADHGILTPAAPEAIADAWTEAVDRHAELTAALAHSRDRFGHERMLDAYAELIERTHRRSNLTAALAG